MPTIGEKRTSTLGRGYAKDPLHAYAAEFGRVATDILRENAVDLFLEPNKVAMHDIANDTLKNFFVENSCDKSGMSAEDYADHIETMTEQYNNDREAVLEYAPASQFNPVIGMTFPIHKNILMNNIFDKGAIPKVVATQPKFTVSMETRILVAPDGTEIDMFKQQNQMMAAIESAAPMREMYLALPETGTTNVLQSLFTATELDNNLSIETYISGVVVSGVYVAANAQYKTIDAADSNKIKTLTADTAGTKNVVYDFKAAFTPAYGEYDRTVMESVDLTVPTGASATSTIKGFISGYMKKNRFGLTASNSSIVGVILKARLDTSTAMLRTASVKWGVRTDIIEIPNAIPINTPISPEEVKDISALYQVNQLTKVMSLFKIALGNYKDDKIRAYLDDSFVNLPATNKLAKSFDFAPKTGYALDPITWRKQMFMDSLDTNVTHLLHVLNDANMTINIVGRDDLIRKISPTEYTYQSPSNIGPVELDFVKTVTTSDKRTYQFISSDKLRDNNNLIVLLCPRNTERFMYRIYDYQMYVSNEIRNSANYALPAIHAFERWAIKEYQPVQARIRILHPTGLTDTAANTNSDPIGSTLGANNFDIDNA